MRTTRFLACLCLATSLLASCEKQVNEPSGPASTWVADETEIRAMVQASMELVTGKFLLSGGEEEDQSGWFTLVWVRTPAGWRAIHDHSS